jgi:drug/metabolite transporter (DMT)-like permease
VNEINPIRAGAILAVVSAVMFGVTTPLVQKFGAHAGPFPTAMLLYVGAAAVSIPSIGGGASHEAPLRAKHLPRLVIVAVLGAVLAPAALAWGLQHTSGTSAALLLNFEAIFTVLLGWRLYHEPLGRRLLTALFLMLLGGACLVLPKGTLRVEWGALAVLAATLGWATDNALTRPLAELDSVQVVKWKSVLGALLSLVLSVALSEPFPHAMEAGALLACGAIGYGLSLRFYLRAQRAIGAARTGSIFSLAPFIGAATAWAFGQRSPVIPTLAAALFFAVAVYLHLTERHRHLHHHAPLAHEHRHRHDDRHHDHVHDPRVQGEHSHPHQHDDRAHSHPHAPDTHHQHRHG